MRTLISRRAVLGVFGLGLDATALAACSNADSSGGSTTGGTTTSTSTSSSSGTARVDLPAGEIPDETAGPYPGDGSNGPDVLEKSGIVRSDLRSSIGAGAAVDGAPPSVTFTLSALANDDKPFENVAVYAWHCDAQKRYSMYSRVSRTRRGSGACRSPTPMAR